MAVSDAAQAVHWKAQYDQIKQTLDTSIVANLKQVKEYEDEIKRIKHTAQQTLQRELVHQREVLQAELNKTRTSLQQREQYWHTRYKEVVFELRSLLKDLPDAIRKGMHEYVASIDRQEKIINSHEVGGQFNA